MKPSPGPVGPRAAEGPEAEPEPEPECAGASRPACSVLAWSAAEVAEWVAQLGFPQYEVRGCRPGQEALALTGAPPEPVPLNAACVWVVRVCERRGGSGDGRGRPAARSPPAFPATSLPGVLQGQRHHRPPPHPRELLPPLRHGRHGLRPHAGAAGRGSRSSLWPWQPGSEFF